MSKAALLAKAKRKASKLNQMQASREALHRRRLKLDVLEAKTREKLRSIEAKQILMADRYNGLVYRIREASR